MRPPAWRPAPRLRPWRPRALVRSRTWFLSSSRYASLPSRRRPDCRRSRPIGQGGSALESRDEQRTLDPPSAAFGAVSPVISRSRQRRPRHHLAPWTCGCAHARDNQDGGKSAPSRFCSRPEQSRSGMDLRADLKLLGCSPLRQPRRELLSRAQASEAASGATHHLRSAGMGWKRPRRWPGPLSGSTSTRFSRRLGRSNRARALAGCG